MSTLIYIIYLWFQDDDEDNAADDKRLADDFKSTTRNNNGSTDAQSKLVKDILSRQAEQDAAARSQTNQPVEESKVVEENKGSGIRLGKLRKTGNDKKGNTTTSSSTATNESSSPNKSFGEGDVERLRTAVQVLVQHTGPLGTCMDFIQEDGSLMTTELHKWEDECRR